jgi:hypothetical protein
LVLDIIGFFEIVTTKSETSGCNKLSDLNDGLAADCLWVESFTMINLALNLLLELLGCLPTIAQQDSRWTWRDLAVP